MRFTFIASLIVLVQAAPSAAVDKLSVPVLITCVVPEQHRFCIDVQALIGQDGRISQAHVDTAWSSPELLFLGPDLLDQVRGFVFMPALDSHGRSYEARVIIRFPFQLDPVRNFIGHQPDWAQDMEAHSLQRRLAVNSIMVTVFADTVLTSHRRGQ